MLSVPRSTIGNVSGCRYPSDCRSRGRKFDLDPVPYFRGDYEIISMVILLPSADSGRAVVRYKRKSNISKNYFRNTI